MKGTNRVTKRLDTIEHRLIGKHGAVGTDVDGAASSPSCPGQVDEDAREARRDDPFDSIQAEVRKAWRRASRLLDRAEEAWARAEAGGLQTRGDTRGVAAIMRATLAACKEVRETLQTLAKLTGELQAAQAQTNVTQIETERRDLAAQFARAVEALADEPAARTKVLAALGWPDGERPEAGS